MKTGAHVEIIGIGLPYEQAFPVFAKMGTKGVELVYRDGGLINANSSDQVFLNARRLAEDNGLEISGMTNGYTWSSPMTSNDPQVRKKGHEALLRALEVAKLLGTDEIQVVPGYANSSFVKSDEVIPVEIAVARAREELQSASEYAQKLGITMNVEVVWNGMLRTPEEMRDFIDSIGSSSVGFYFDTGNVYPEGNPEKWVRILAQRIGRVHIKDFIPGLPGLNVFGSLGTGVIDFPAVMVALHEVGYNGWLGAEHHINRNIQEATHSVQFIQKLTEM